MNQELRVLLALSDKSFAQNLIDKFRSKHPSCPLQFDLVDDGQRAINEVRFFRPQVAVIDNDFPGLAGDALAQEILSLYSECYIVIALEKGEQSDVGLPIVELPVLSWEKALIEITKGLPIDFQIEHSLFKRDRILLEKLDFFSKKYQSTTQDQTELIKTWNLVGGSQATQKTANDLPGPVSESNEKIIHIPSRWTLIEFAVVLTLGVLLALSWFAFEIEGSLGWTLKLSLMFGFIFSCVGFFAFRIAIRGQKN